MTVGDPQPELPGYLRAMHRADRAIQRAEVAVCLVSLALMILLAFAQVFLRQFRGVELGPFEIPQPVGWFDNIARHLVIWVGLLGASLAAAEGRHIAIEAVPKLLGPRGRRAVEALTQVAALLVTGMLLALCLVYLVRIQGPNDAHLFRIQALDITVYRWPLLVVVPAALGLMCWRFALRILEAVVLDDATYAALRKESLEADLEALEAAHERDAVERLVRESGRYDPHDPAHRDSARAEVRRASGRAAEGELAGAAQALGATGAAVEGAASVAADRATLPRCAACGEDLAAERPRRACPDCGTWQHTDCWERRGGCESCARREARRAAGGVASLRSTDEIPVYRELADDEDLLEPEVRRGAALLDSTEELDPAVDDLAESAMDAVADTERLRLGQAVREAESTEELEARPTTERLPRGQLPAGRPQVVVVVRRPEETP